MPGGHSGGPGFGFYSSLGGLENFWFGLFLRLKRILFKKLGWDPFLGFWAWSLAWIALLEGPTIWGWVLGLAEPGIPEVFLGGSLISHIGIPKLALWGFHFNFG